VPFAAAQLKQETDMSIRKRTWKTTGATPEKLGSSIMPTKAGKRRWPVCE